MRLILFLLAFSLSFSIGAQSMSFSPGLNYYGTAELDNYSVYQIDILNEEADTLLLGWKFLEKTTPEDWTITLCDNAVCYGYIPINGFMSPILDEPAFLKLDINPHTTHGEGIVTFQIFDIEDQSNLYEIRFHVTTLLVNNENIAEVAIEIFPNPASDYLMVGHADTDKINISITNAVGQPVYNSYLLPNEKRKILTNDFVDGIYFMLFEKDQSVISTKQILITR